MSLQTAIYWFRKDLRVRDNPALTAALAENDVVVPVYIHAEATDRWGLGNASAWWLDQSLRKLNEELAKLGTRLIVRKGELIEEVGNVAREADASRVYWNRCFNPGEQRIDQRLIAALSGANIETRISNDSFLLFMPWDIETKSGSPYRVFTPFYKSCLSAPQPREYLPGPECIRPPTTWPDSTDLDGLRLLPSTPWYRGFSLRWQPGETSAQSKLERFRLRTVSKYLTSRESMDDWGTSRLSPHLDFGEISPYALWHAVDGESEGGGAFRRQLVWREFAHHLLHHFPETTDEPFRSEYRSFPWRTNDELLKAWQKGVTGYPVVDAGMRELWTTGWMHNRARMIAASFLTKQLNIHWLEGARWFWDTLVDASLANNTFGWQWAAGCGADAAPYYRIFNPVRQGRRFDPQGDYVRHWVPELRKLPNEWIHCPWEAPKEVLFDADIVLGKAYPEPIVYPKAAREAALARYRKWRDGES
jgi:deoxyribodipyrimidine photo-lyase